MVTEKERVAEWLTRVQNDIKDLKMSNASVYTKIKLLRQNYDVLLVLTKVAAGTAFMVGIPPITQKSNK